MHCDKLVHDPYPEAIHVLNGFGKTPLDIAELSNWARRNPNTEVADFIHSQLECQAPEIVQPDSKGQLPIHRVFRSSEVSLGAIKLIVASNPASLTVPDTNGYLPLHFACENGHFDAVKYLIEVNEELLKVKTSEGYFPLHLACLGGNCNIINCILERSFSGLSLRANGKLPIELLLGDFANCDSDSLECVEAVGRLLCANPMKNIQC
jgi:ankyrin repeat protein